MVVIEVDGLEAKDVNPQTTPFLWALGHSGISATQTLPPPSDISPVAIGATTAGGFAGRNGFTWQAARGTMTATTAAATASLLTGSYAAKSGVIGNEYFETSGSHYLMGGDLGDSSISDMDGGNLGSTSVLGAVDESGGHAAAFIGDPALDGLVSADDTVVQWHPATTDSVPAYCPVPQDSEEAQAQGSAAEASAYACPTPDINVLNQAESKLSSSADGDVKLAYIYLAELGVMKRIYGDVDDRTTPAGQAIAKQLENTDAAIGTFVEHYWADQGPKWDKTVLMVVGNHGYETTPVSHRVPDPAATANTDTPDCSQSTSSSKDDSTTPNPGMGIGDYLHDCFSTSIKFVPQGTVGFVYVPDAQKSMLPDIANALKPKGVVDSQSLCQQSTIDTVDSAAQPLNGCIHEVLSTGAVDAKGHSTIPGNVAPSVQDAHPGWNIHALDSKGKPTGADGDLMVVLNPGWAAGVLVPVKNDQTAVDPFDVYTSTNGSQIQNPYFGSPGGPRNRSIAAIINGPTSTVRQVLFSQLDTSVGNATDTIDSYPVSKDAVDPANCPKDNYDPLTTDPNADPGDDANAAGHECQAETVDFAPTIAALLKVSLADSQLDGRFLQEAFSTKLSPVTEEQELPPPTPDDPPPPSEPDLHIPPPPPPPKGFDYDGLLRAVKATVVDVNGCSWDTARPGAKMDYLDIEADLGKPLSATTLTFYQAAPHARVHLRHQSNRAARAIAAANTRTAGFGGPKKKNKCLTPPKKARAHKADAPAAPALKAIAKFSPFALKRGHVKLKLKIPPLYMPTHIGLFVQEARKLTVPQVQANGEPGPGFEPFGPAAGDIVRVVDADHLHKTKPAAKRSAARSKATARSRRS